jgi:hypothetical protein
VSDHTDIFAVEDTCRSCGSAALEDVVAFGSTPLADRLLREDQLAEDELRADLTLTVCRDCALAQIRETVDPEVLFFAEYPYFSSVSPSLMQHFAASAHAIIDRFGLDESSTVVEAASNDGYMLRNFAERGIEVLGVDPAKAPAQAALDAGIPTLIDFFGRDLAQRLVGEGTRADVFLGNNVLAHVPDLNGFVAGIATLLTERGVAVIEAPYVVDLVDHCEFDTIYHQHLCYFSVTALVELFERHGLHLNDVEQTPIHGGSLRLFVQRTDDRGERVERLLRLERERGFDGPQAYQDFAERISTLRTDLRAILDDVKADGARIAGYGAAAKATTLLAYCDIDGDDLEYVCDLNEYKQGRYMGGNHLPIVPPATLTEDRPDHVLILAWNFADEIIRQNQDYRDGGGTFIVPVPTPRIVE